MAVESDLDRAQYATNGTTGPWTVPFYFLIDTDLQVTYTAADGTETTLSLNSDYSVTGAGNPNGGTVTTTADYAAGGFITVLRDMEFVQEVVYPESGPFPAKTHETALDRLTMMAQQLREQVGRALSFGAGEVGSAQLPSASDRKGKIIGFDAVTGALILIAGSIGSALDLATQYASSTGSTLMGFIQSAAGAIATTVAKKLARVLDAVVDFGADPTGATNSTVALQAFYAACITSGKRGYIPPGTYLVTPGQLVFTATTYQAWPHIETAGHWCTTFKVDPSTHVNAPILAWNNGVQTSTAPSAQWYGGSHGGVTFLDTTGDSAPLRSGMSFAGMWGIEFGWIKGQSLTGDVITVPVSAKRGQGMDALRAALMDRKVVLSGPSGVGKSSLIRALIPGAAPEVGDVRKGDGKGRHTTTTSNLYQAGGITIIDTPGIRELGVRGVPRREFAQYWRDFGAYAGECRFRDCIHVNEPGCAVREAVEAGDLPDFRYQSYLRILDDLEA